MVDLEGVEPSSGQVNVDDWLQVCFRLIWQLMILDGKNIISCLTGPWLSFGQKLVASCGYNTRDLACRRSKADG